MVLAVHEGHNMNKKGVEKWLIFTILGGLAFLGCQAWEWTHLITGDHQVLVNGVVEHWGTTVSHNPWGPEVEYNGSEIASPGPIAFGVIFLGSPAFMVFMFFQV
jgi:cytochrome c oxidase subunit 3